MHIGIGDKNAPVHRVVGEAGRPLEYAAPDCAPGIPARIEPGDNAELRVGNQNLAVRTGGNADRCDEIGEPVRLVP